MKSLINGLQRAFENRIRLGIMAALAVNESLDFNSLKKYLNLTDGNLASHLKSLEKEKYISMKKSFINRKPNTAYSISKSGVKVFEEHILALEKLIEMQKELQS